MKDEKYMLRALELSSLGLGRVSPNPVVGAVIVHNDVIIGEGYHMAYGEAHAEVNAIKSVKNIELLPQSTIYVTLEPCSHWGKTPPCADLIIEKKIKRVVVGVVDPNDKVCGNGIKKLKDAGIEVEIGVLKNECTEINAPFFTAQTKNRPHVILKWAQTSDGFIDIERNVDIPVKWFTGPLCKTVVHKWRSQIDCIMVGRKTVELDDPELNVRSYFGRNPVRATIDGDLKLNPSYKIFNDAAKTILFTKSENIELGKTKFNHLKNVEIAPLDYTSNIPQQICNYLFNNKLNSLFIEGGKYLIDSFIKENLWDEARIFTADQTIEQIYQTDSKIKLVKAPTVAGVDEKSVNYQNCTLKVVKPE